MFIYLMSCRSSFALLDNQQRIIVILAGHSNNKDWPALHELAAEALESRRDRCLVPKKEKRSHQRGQFIALRCGVSLGGGQKRLSLLHNEP